MNQQAGSGRQMLRGASWMVALRWTIRLSGVLSTIILARLLSPRDFGIVAMAMIAVSLFETLSLTGHGAALIRHRDPVRAHYDSAWTMSMIIGATIAVLIFLSAPLAGLYFRDPRAVPVMRCLALRPLLNGMENIGIVNFRRDLRFDRVFGYNIGAKLMSLGVTITLAVLLRNYWALVAGIIVGQLARTALSYALHPYRPRLSIFKVSEIWSFSSWVFVRAVGGYVVDQVDVIAVGGVAGSTTMGSYTVAKDVASSPVDELNAPMISVLFPVMARVQGDLVELRRLYLRTLGWSAIIGISTGIGVMMVAPELVLILLGSKWIMITPLMGWLALTAGVATLTYSGFSLLDILGLPSLGAKLQWTRALFLMLAVAPVALLSNNLVSVAIARFTMTVLFVPTLLVFVSMYAGVAFKSYVEVLWRPLAAGLFMAVAVSGLNAMVPMIGVIRLVFDVAVGMGSFCGTLLGLWSLSGRPASAERDLIGLVTEARQRVRSIRDRQ